MNKTSLPSLSYVLTDALPSGGLYRKGLAVCGRMGSGFAPCSQCRPGDSGVNLEAVAPQERWAGSSKAPRAGAHWGVVEQDGPGHVLRCSLPLDVMTPITRGRSSGPQSVATPAPEVRQAPSPGLTSFLYW